MRQDLTLFDLDIDEANERLKLIILGLRLEQAVDKELSTVLEIIHDATSITERMIRHIELFNTPSEKLSPNNEIGIKEAAVDAMKNCQNILKIKIKDFEKAHQKLTIKLLIIKKQCQDATEFAEILKKVENEFMVFKTTFSRLDKKTSIEKKDNS